MRQDLITIQVEIIVTFSLIIWASTWARFDYDSRCFPWITRENHSGAVNLASTESKVIGMTKENTEKSNQNKFRISISQYFEDSWMMDIQGPDCFFARRPLYDVQKYISNQS